jgi:ribokinase
MKNLWVIGSINIDLVAETPRFVEPGETLTGLSYSEFTGGKGANQAVALARLGTRPMMVGQIGDDTWGQRYRHVFQREGVDDRSVRAVPGLSTGIALIEVVSSGENRIIIIPGANGAVEPVLIDQILPRVEEGDIALLQLEIPIDTVFHAIRGLKRRKATVILDPAPARALPNEILPLIDYLTPNESEARLLAGTVSKGDDAGLIAAKSLLRKGSGCIILKAGSRGSWVVSADRSLHVQPYPVCAIDTTAAGDSFNAGLAFALAQDKPIEEAASFANAVAALSTTAKGAQPAMPTLIQIDEFLRKEQQRGL